MSEEIFNHDTDENLADFITESDRIYNIKEVVAEKLTDAMTPGFMAEFDPLEAEFAGAFVEDALSEADALEAAYDLSHDMEAPAFLDDEGPSLEIPPFITTTNARELYGLRPDETLLEAMARYHAKKDES